MFQYVIYAIPGLKWLGEHSYFYSMLFNTAWVYAKLSLERLYRNADVDFAVSTDASATDYEERLALQLITRIHEVCRENGIKLIVVDIPAIKEGTTGIKSSLGETLSEQVENRSDALVSIDLLKPYEDVVSLHLPHGYRHISEFTHTLIGVRVADEIQRMMADAGK